MLKQMFIRRSVIGCCLLAFILSAAGCASLREKFIRKKKKEKGQEQAQAFIPVLEPEEYAVKVYTPEQRYRHHYALWKVWNEELLTTIRETESDRRERGADKKQKYLLNQLITQLQEMSQWVQEAHLRG